MTAERAAPRYRIAVTEALVTLGEFDAIIDARSESEYADDHIPGALNCPVLNDAERALIGTLYAQDSPFAARRRGAALAARNIAAHLEQRFAALPGAWRPLVYCWRGGERSAALTHVLERVGWRARQLEGGYRAFRRLVLAELDELPARFDLRVICGPTGSGKSRLLRALAQVGAQVLDLEELAKHRGSVLGELPQAPQPSQKRFETLIWWTLRRFAPARPVFVESESRRVGRLRVPTVLIERMRAAPCLKIELPLSERVRLLRDEYEHFERVPQDLIEQLECLLPLHGHAPVAQWKDLAAAHEWDRLVEALLTRHYDPAYARSIRKNFVQAEQAEILRIACADATEYAAAAQTLAAR
jgi:tRNA 2-selenouridine synthase